MTAGNYSSIWKKDKIENKYLIKWPLSKKNQQLMLKYCSLFWDLDLIAQSPSTMWEWHLMYKWALFRLLLCLVEILCRLECLVLCLSSHLIFEDGFWHFLFNTMHQIGLPLFHGSWSFPIHMWSSHRSDKNTSISLYSWGRTYDRTWYTSKFFRLHC